MVVKDLEKAMLKISSLIDENKEYLVQLDQMNGDGDLGISMSAGFHAVCDYLRESEEKDFGKVVAKSGSIFNEAAPSSLGTIISFGFMGMAKNLRGKEEIDTLELANALVAGVDKIMEKAGSKPGERTILDAIYPAVRTFKEYAKMGKKDWKAAAREAAAGAEKTKYMKPVHGRAAYYGEKSLGQYDGGAVVGKLIFEALCN